MTNADGSGALNSAHAGAMGEGWSDWYASDLQVRDGLKTDTADARRDRHRRLHRRSTCTRCARQALDCPVDAVGADLPRRRRRPAAGGYTLGDFGKIFFAGPEVHADGELWAETLWDLRQALGTDLAASDVAETLVTDGMRLSPPEPSMLDMRNAILSRRAGQRRRRSTTTWSGRSSARAAWATSPPSSDGADTEPVEDFSPPPAAAGPKGTVTGVVTDPCARPPIAGVRVGFGGHASGDAPTTSPT